MDDHRDTSDMLQMLLAEEDYEVHTAATMQEACSFAQNTEYDLYVLDKRLPDGTGIQLCQTLQELTPSVPCIFYTGDAYEIHRQRSTSGRRGRVRREAGYRRFNQRGSRTSLQRKSAPPPLEFFCAFCGKGSNLTLFTTARIIFPASHRWAVSSVGRAADS